MSGADEVRVLREYYFTADEGVKGHDWDKFLNSPMVAGESPLNRLMICVLELSDGTCITGEYLAPAIEYRADDDAARKQAQRRAMHQLETWRQMVIHVEYLKRDRIARLRGISD